MVLYGLLGARLGHSYSAKMFNEKFARDGIDAEYRNFELPDISLLPGLVAEYPELRGLNVTIPYKRTVIPFLSRLDPVAQAVGAVNTIRIMPDGEMIGYNTDAPAFRDSLTAMLPSDHDIRALIFGTGGASGAVAWALENLGIDYCFVSRRVSPNTRTLTYEQLTPDVIAACRLLINCTPLGTAPQVDSCVPIDYEAITGRHLCHDLVYNPPVTEFMRRAAAHGAAVKNGLEMLRAQAHLAYQIWTTK